MVAERFTPHGTILFRPHIISNYKELTQPIPARFVSGHFFFTIGKHCEEYKYDPNIYFAGDEISLSIRSFTLGYDLFHPHKLVVWHEYTRQGRVKHWDDFNENNVKSKKVEKQWWEMDNESKRRLRHMLQEEDNKIDLDVYGLGNVRSHRDYELYSGIDFKRRQLHPKTLEGIDPPINDDTDWYLNQEKSYKFNLKIPVTKDFKFIYIGVEDNDGKVVYRQDLTKYVDDLNITFKSFTKPVKWIYWPVDLNGNWGNKVEYSI
jgi:hypothetical protein